MNTDYKFIRIRKEVYNDFAELGKYRESANDILKRVIDFYKKKNKGVKIQTELKK